MGLTRPDRSRAPSEPGEQRKRPDLTGRSTGRLGAMVDSPGRPGRRRASVAGPGPRAGCWRRRRAPPRTPRCSPPPTCWSTGCAELARRQRGRPRSRGGRRAWRPARSTGCGSPRPGIAAMAAGLRTVAALPDPVGEVLDGWRRPNGLLIERVRVPLGVVAIIYENRPNVTSDAAGLCLKSGNAALLRGSSTALRSNLAIAAAAARSAREGRPPRRRRDPRRRPVARGRHRGDAAHRVRRLPHPPRRARA